MGIFCCFSAKNSKICPFFGLFGKTAPLKVREKYAQGNERTGDMTDSEKLIAEGFRVFAADIASHKAALDRLVENQEAQQRALVEQAKMINAHSGILESLRLAVEAKSGNPPAEPESVN